MFEKISELSFQLRTRHFKFIERRNPLRFQTSGYYPYQIMGIGESFLVVKGNMQTLAKKLKAINKELNKTFVAKIEPDGIRITRIK